MNQKQRYPVFAEHASFSSVQEQFPEISEEAHLVFKDENGAIRAGCYFGEIDLPIFDLGLVPDKIANQSPEAIQTYGKNKLQRLIKREKKRINEGVERVQNLLSEYELSHHGIRICGNVRKGIDNGARDDRMILTMTEPFQIVAEIHVRPQCYGDAMAGVRTFDEDGYLLPQEINRQEKTLIELYDREIRRRNRPPKHPALAHLPNARSDDDD
jgi:hypothetical protein